MATVITASRATARIALRAVVMAYLRSLSLVDWRSLAGGEVERAPIRSLTDQRWRIDLVVGEPTLPVAGHEDVTVDPGNQDVAIWHPSIGRRRGWCGRYPGHRARRRATKTVEHRTPRRGTSRRCHQPARAGRMRGDAKHDYRGQQHPPQPHDRVPPGCSRPSRYWRNPSRFSLTPFRRLETSNGWRRDYDESTHRSNGGRALPPADDPARQRASALRDRGSIANRARRLGLSRQHRQPHPAPRRPHDPPRHVQEAPLASERADLLSAPPALRQALQRAGPAGRRHRRAHPIAGWREHRHGPRRGRDDADPAPATRTRGSPSAALEAASRPRDRLEGSPCDGAAGGRGGR